jgi:hypothetical protein
VREAIGNFDIAKRHFHVLNALAVLGRGFDLALVLMQPSALITQSITEPPG